MSIGEIKVAPRRAGLAERAHAPSGERASQPEKRQLLTLASVRFRTFGAPAGPFWAWHPRSDSGEALNSGPDPPRNVSDIAATRHSNRSRHATVRQ